MNMFIAIIYAITVYTRVFFLNETIDYQQILFNYETVILITTWLYYLYARNIEKNLFLKCGFISFLIEVLDFVALTYFL